MGTPGHCIDLAGRVALVTGASRGLGLAMARALGRAGARLIITARKSAELEDAAQQLRSAGIEVLARTADVGTVAATPDLVRDLVNETGQIDVLVNNAGATWGAAAAEHPYEAWQKVMDVNLNGAWVLTQQVAVQSMLPRRSGSIVFVASILGLGGNRGMTPTVAYNSSKAAQINLARSLAAEWGPHGVRVNALLPGWFLTRMSRGTLAEYGDPLLAAIPLGRFGDPEADITGPMLFLASDMSRYVTGQTLVVDGGMTAPV
jgi:NAD(P)-dependent dehydrogenase (short-subunit alcohol dehydrogenase family)